MRLSELAMVIGGRATGGDPEVRGVSADSRRVERGDLFVAVPGATTDGARFVSQALERGAVAICGVAPADGIPSIVTTDPRRDLAALAAAIHGYPARQLTLVGVTGSLGKTSTSLLAQTALQGGGLRVGIIGSLGVRFGESIVQTGMTTPEAPQIHAALRSMVDAGATLAVMEVTSHSIQLERVAGLRFDLGLLTNLVPDEHLEFHPTPEHYIRTKLRFLDMLKPGAPLLANFDDPIGGRHARAARRPVVGVTMNGADDASVVVTDVQSSVRGSEFTLRVRRPLPGLAGVEVAPRDIRIPLPILGGQQVGNAALAATAALLAGVPDRQVATGLGAARPMRRRMEIVRDADPVVLDDTVGNPESIRAVFDAARTLLPARLRVAYVIRGSRGATINERNARTLAEEVRGTGAELVVSASDDVADERNRVTGDERDVVLAALRETATSFDYEPTLRGAIRRTLDGAGEGTLVLLLGAQGMDRGAEMAREMLGTRGA